MNLSNSTQASPKITVKQPLVFCCRLLLLGSFHAAGKCKVLWNITYLYLLLPQFFHSDSVIAINVALCNYLFPFSCYGEHKLCIIHHENDTP